MRRGFEGKQSLESLGTGTVERGTVGIFRKPRLQGRYRRWFDAGGFQFHEGIAWYIEVYQ